MEGGSNAIFSRSRIATKMVLKAVAVTGTSLIQCRVDNASKQGRPLSPTKSHINVIADVKVV